MAAEEATSTVAGVVTETFYVQNGSSIYSYVSSVEVAPVNYGLYVALGVLALVIGSVAFALRIYVRRIMVKTFGWDDWVLAAAYFVYVGYVALYLAIPGRIVHEGLQTAYFDAIGDSNVWLAVYGVVASLIRLATAAFFLRVVPVQTLYRWHRVLLITVVSTYSIFSIITGFLLMAQCGLSKMELDYQIDTPKCFNADTMYDLLFAQSIATAVSDWLMTIVPIAVIFKGAMSSRLKWTTVPVILLASAGGVLAIIRIPFNKFFILYGPQDMGKYMIWLTLSLYESCIAISATSIVATRPLMQKWFGRYFTSTNYGSQYYTSRVGGRKDSAVKEAGSIRITRATEVSSMPKSGADTECGSFDDQSA